MTVLGPVPAGDLGPTLMHEHVRVMMMGAELDTRGALDRKTVIAIATDRLAELKEHGVATFVDPCPIELGRDPELMAEVSQRSGVHIVCATGFYHEDDGKGIPYYWRMRHPDEIAELFVSELTDGIGGSGIRPGIVKLASAAPMGRHESKVVAAGS